MTDNSPVSQTLIRLQQAVALLETSVHAGTRDNLQEAVQSVRQALASHADEIVSLRKEVTVLTETKENLWKAMKKLEAEAASLRTETYRL